MLPPPKYISITTLFYAFRFHEEALSSIQPKIRSGLAHRTSPHSSYGFAERSSVRNGTQIPTSAPASSRSTGNDCYDVTTSRGSTIRRETNGGASTNGEHREPPYRGVAEERRGREYTSSPHHHHFHAHTFQSTSRDPPYD